jgi:long-chain acyl-CoA synthetase
MKGKISFNFFVNRGIYQRNTIYDKFVFNKIREKFGGKVCRMASGSAPISDEVMSFSKAVFGSPIPEGYGQTEATCSITFCHPFDPNQSHVGAPISCYMVKLVDVPDMGYLAKNNQGEVSLKRKCFIFFVLSIKMALFLKICAKGPSRFMGYLKDQEKTAEAIDQDGWLYTGDVNFENPF